MVMAFSKKFFGATAILVVDSINLLPPIAAEKVWLKKFPAFPGVKTLEVVHFFTFDKATSPQVDLLGPVTLNVKPEDIESDGLALSVIPHAKLAALTKESSFCCEPGSTSKACVRKNLLGLEGSFTFPVNSTTLNGGFGNFMFQVPATGLYYITLSNCGDVMPFKGGEVKFKTGEVSAVGSGGFLPAEEHAKLYFYQYLSIGYVGLLIVWAVWCSAWSEVLFKIHHYITVTIVVGLVEGLCWYASLYHWNYLGHRWWSMMALASCGTVVKQGTSYGLLLLACLGLGVTKPRLQGKQVMQTLLLVTAFILSDGVRQLALLMQDRINGVDSNWKIILLVTPGSFFVSMLYVWIGQALQDTIAELNTTRQTVKAEVYQSLRLALGLVIGTVIALVAYETLVVRRTELAENWSTRYIFTDVLSHCCFIFLLGVIMILWRPSERSVQMAYSEQLESGPQDGIDEGIEMGKKHAENFDSVDVELGDDPADNDAYDFKKSMEEAVGGENKKRVPDVLE